MKQTLVILRGAPASGKTSLGKNLRDFNKKIVWLKVDNFKPFFAEDSNVALDMVNETALNSLSYILDKGCSVLLDGIFKNPDYVYKAVKIAQSKNIPHVLYQLSCSLKTLLERDKKREGVPEGCRKPMEEDIVESIYNELENTPIEGAVILDTESQSLEQCLEIIKKNFDQI